MNRLPKFSSPLLIRPHAKQLRYLVFIGIVYLLLQIYSVYTSLRSMNVVSCIAAVLMLCCAAYHIIHIRRGAEQDVTVLIPTICAIGGAQILIKLMYFFTALSAFGIKNLLFFLLECAFWVVLVFCMIRAILGKYKLIIPLLLLFAMFFYTFIKYDLRDIVSIASQICLMLMLWFPIDAIAFTSLYDPNKKS